jgi:hypothetical protein
MSILRTEAWLFASVTPDLAPNAVPTVRARVACPETGGINRVRLVVDPVTGHPAVTWCERFDGREVTCERSCLNPETETGEPA